MTIAIIGLSAIHPYGVGLEPLREGLIGRGSLASPSLLPADEFPDARTNEIPDWDPNRYLGAKGHRHFDRLTRFLASAAQLALNSAGLREGGAYSGGDPAKVALLSATAFGSLDEITEQNRIAELEDPRYINPTRFPNTVINAAAGYVSIREGFTGPNATLVNGRTGFLSALSLARGFIEAGEVQRALVGGGEVISDALYLGLELSGGFTVEPELRLGEGAGFFVLEEAAEAEARGATILARLLGERSAYEPPEDEEALYQPSALAVSRALRGALADAGLERVDAVVLSGHGFGVYREAEREGARAILGASIPILDPGADLGEAFAASPIFALSAAALLFHDAELRQHLALSSEAPPETLAFITLGHEGHAGALILERGDGLSRPADRSAD